MSPLLMYGVAAFLVLYGTRALIAGIRNEQKTYHIIIGYDGTKGWLKDKYYMVHNLVWGSIDFLIGVTIVLMYRP